MGTQTCPSTCPPSTATTAELSSRTDHPVWKASRSLLHGPFQKKPAQSSLPWLAWPSASWAGITGWNPPCGGPCQPLPTLLGRLDPGVFSGRRRPSEQAHPWCAGIPVASPVFTLQTPRELIFHAISAENSHGLEIRAAPPGSADRLAAGGWPRCAGPGQALSRDSGLEE